MSHSPSIQNLLTSFVVMSLGFVACHSVLTDSMRRRKLHSASVLPIVNPPRRISSQNLHRKLRRLGLVAHDIPNSFPNSCQYDSVRDQLVQLYGDRGESKYVVPTAHVLRTMAIEWLRRHGDSYEIDGVPLGDWMGDGGTDKHVTHLSRQGTVGDIYTLVALSNLFNMRVQIIKHAQSDETITPHSMTCDDAPRTITIGYYPEWHYVSTRRL